MKQLIIRNFEIIKIFILHILFVFNIALFFLCFLLIITNVNNLSKENNSSDSEQSDTIFFNTYDDTDSDDSFCMLDNSNKNIVDSISLQNLNWPYELSANVDISGMAFYSEVKDFFDIKKNLRDYRLSKYKSDPSDVIFPVFVINDESKVGKCIIEYTYSNPFASNDTNDEIHYKYYVVDCLNYKIFDSKGSVLPSTVYVIEKNDYIRTMELSGLFIEEEQIYINELHARTVANVFTDNYLRFSYDLAPMKFFEDNLDDENVDYYGEPIKDDSEVAMSVDKAMFEKYKDYFVSKLNKNIFKQSDFIPNYTGNEYYKLVGYNIIDSSQLYSYSYLVPYISISNNLYNQTMIANKKSSLTGIICHVSSYKAYLEDVNANTNTNEYTNTITTDVVSFNSIRTRVLFSLIIIFVFLFVFMIINSDKFSLYTTYRYEKKKYYLRIILLSIISILIGSIMYILVLFFSGVKINNINFQYFIGLGSVFSILYSLIFGFIQSTLADHKGL